MICGATLDSVAPVKTRNKVPASVSPRLNDHTSTFKSELGKAEHKWKACKLQVFYEIMKELMRNDNVAG